MSEINLSTLIAPLKIDSFFEKHWRGEPLFVPSNGSMGLRNLFPWKCFEDVNALTSAYNQKVRACLPDVGDESRSLMLAPQDAIKAYESGMTLIFDNVDQENAQIAQGVENIRKDLGLVTGGALNDLCRARSIVYATPEAGETSCHFDANVNFVVQLRGKKVWSLAPNHSVKNPTERFSPASGEISMALENQCHDQLLFQMPSDAIEYVMESGALLFVPRGYWHATTTEEESLSLNFTFSQPTWADVLTKSLHEHLLCSSQWRELAHGLGSPKAETQDKGIQRFESLLIEFGKLLPHLSGEALLRNSGLVEPTQGDKGSL